MKSEGNRNILWCLKQKYGIKLEEPNTTLCKVYLKKAKSALNMLSAASEKEEVDWMATTAYYARYFAFYALLQRCGIKSEIHDCTISLMNFLFAGENLLDKELYNELQRAKKLRVDLQYYTAEDLDIEKLKYDTNAAIKFVLKIEEFIGKINEKHIERLRERINKADKTKI